MGKYIENLNKNNEEQEILELMALIKTKAQQYGNTDLVIADFLEKIYPNGIETKDYDKVLFTLKLVEKIARINSENIKNEALEDAYMDIIGYGLLGFSANKDKNNKLQSEYQETPGTPIKEQQLFISVPCTICNQLIYNVPFDIVKDQEKFAHQNCFEEKEKIKTIVENK